MTLLSTAYDWYIRRAYFLDWLVASAVFAVGANAFEIASPNKAPFQRFYTKTDPTLSYPILNPRFTDAHIIAVFCGVPLLSFAVVCGLWRRKMAEWHHATLGWWVGLALVQFTMGYMSLVGRYRPNFINGIGPHATIKGSKWNPNRAYPQPAAGACLLTGTYMFLWAVGRMQLFSKPSKGAMLKLVLACLPLAYGVNLALSRVADYWVDFSDFNAGSFIGIASACISYLLFFPWVTSPNSGHPKVDREGWAYGFTSHTGSSSDNDLHKLQLNTQLSAPVNDQAVMLELPVSKASGADEPV